MPHTRNVTGLYRQTTSGERYVGRTWYSDAHDAAWQIANAHDVPVHVAAGVIAAVSPRNGWARNLQLAERIIATDDTSQGYLKTGLASARRILDGADPLDVLSAPKIRNFYRSIISRGDDGVCVDRHAIDIADGKRRSEGDRPGLTPNQYEAYAECYRRAARILSRELGRPVSPAEVQATTWVAWRNRYVNTKKHDPKED